MSYPFIGAIDTEQETIDISDWVYRKVPLEQLRQWCENRIAAGKNYVDFELHYGYYDDISEMIITAKE